MRIQVSIVLIAACAIAGVGCESSNAPTAPSSLAVPPAIDAAVQSSAGASIRIVQGEIVFDHAPLFDLKGTNGFRFEGGAITSDTATGTFFAAHCHAIGCAPATAFPFERSWSGNDFGADAVFRGTVYREVGGLLAESSAIIKLSGSLRFPPAGPPTTSATSPFELSGTFFLPGARIPLTGSGNATWALEWSTVDRSWYIRRAVFRFVPRP